MKRSLRVTIPIIARIQYLQELKSWSFLAFTLGAVEGTVVAVLLKNLYQGVVDTSWLNLAVAITTGAPAFANIVSIFWAENSLGKHKIKTIVRLAYFFSCCLLLIGIAPRSEYGFWLIVIATVLARVFWCGVVTIRSVIWRANYQRQIRGKVTGKLTVVFALIMSLAGLLIGFVARYQDSFISAIYILMAILGAIGAFKYKRTKLRQHRKLINLEKQNLVAQPEHLFKSAFNILKMDKAYRNYMICMFIFGSGNLMLMAPLILMMNDVFDFSLLQQIMLTSALPLIMIPLATPLWSQFLDKQHVVHYRQFHSWSFVISIGTFLCGMVLQETWLLWLGSAFLGISYAGGLLGWNLGHHDFAPPHQATQYMGIHVTLNGIRGLIMPIVGINLYQIMFKYFPELATWTLALPLLLSFSGAVGFILLKRQMNT